MTILALIKHEIPVSIEDVYEMGGVKLAVVKALDGQPFVGGDKWPIRGEYTTVKASELSGGVICDRAPEEVEAIMAAYRKALEAAKEGKLDMKRVKRGLVLALANQRRPYETTPSSCSCPDAEKGNWCKHRIAALLWLRAGVEAPGQVTEDRDLPLEPERENLLHMALKYQDKKQWRGREVVPLLERNGKAKAWLKNIDEQVALFVEGIQDYVVVYILDLDGWRVSSVVVEKYHEWARKAKAALAVAG